MMKQIKLRNLSLAISLYLIVASLLILSVFFFQDYRHCKRDYDTQTCVKYFFRYQMSNIVGGCFINKVEQQGIAPESQMSTLPIDVYFSNITEDKVEQLIQGVNDIWNQYSIGFEVRSLDRINHNATKIKAYNCTELKQSSELIVGDLLYSDLVTDVILAEFKEKDVGRGLKSFHPCDNKSISLVVVSVSSRNLTWNLAHEFGHILGLEDKAFYSGELNFMTHSGCIKDRYYPTLLNQTQVDTVLSTAKDLSEN